MANGVKVVKDGDLPDGCEWAFVRLTCGSVVVLVAESSTGSARAIGEAWAAYQAIATGPIPQQRHLLAV